MNHFRRNGFGEQCIESSGKTGEGAGQDEGGPLIEFDVQSQVCGALRVFTDGFERGSER